MLDFGRRIRDVDGHVYGSHAQACDVEQYRVDGFVHLHGNAVAGLDAPPHQRCSEPCGLAAKRCIAHFPARGGSEKQPLRLTASRAIDPVGRICSRRHGTYSDLLSCRRGGYAHECRAGS